MDLLLDQWDLWRRQLASLQDEIVRRQQACPVAALVATMPGAGAFGSLALAARMDRIERFPRPESLANYWGLTPSCRNSGERSAAIQSISGWCSEPRTAFSESCISVSSYPSALSRL